MGLDNLLSLDPVILCRWAWEYMAGYWQLLPAVAA